MAGVPFEYRHFLIIAWADQFAHRSAQRAIESVPPAFYYLIASIALSTMINTRRLVIVHSEGIPSHIIKNFEHSRN
jgi:hypothetical protein